MRSHEGEFLLVSLGDGDLIEGVLQIEAADDLSVVEILNDVVGPGERPATLLNAVIEFSVVDNNSVSTVRLLHKEDGSGVVTVTRDNEALFEELIDVLAEYT